MRHWDLDQDQKQTIVRSLPKSALRIVIAVWMISLMVTSRNLAGAEEPQKTFSTPEEAAHAMAEALQKDDRAELLTIFGPDSKGLLISGDPVEDEDSIKTFLKGYDQMHRFSKGRDGRLFLIVGAQQWPLPIPLKKKAEGWYFDTPYGKEEYLYRRIGGNEFAAIRTLNAIVAGEHEYFDKTHDKGAAKQYAQKILSDPGTQDGLFWKASSGEPESPIGPLIAEASQEGYHAEPDKPVPPFHGYYFKLLTAAGKGAPGGAEDYVVDGKMTKGFGVIAYPAIYRSSGVMTFIVDANGNVLEKDLGPKTDKTAPAINSYNPDKSWRRVG